MEKKFIIVDINTKEIQTDESGKVNIYNTIDDAAEVCGIYEFNNVWICQLIYNHIEGE